MKITIESYDKLAIHEDNVGGVYSTLNEAESDQDTCEKPAIPDGSFESEIRRIINQGGRESNSDTPDFILAEYLYRCLLTFEDAVNQRRSCLRRK